MFLRVTLDSETALLVLFPFAGRGVVGEPVSGERFAAQLNRTLHDFFFRFGFALSDSVSVFGQTLAGTPWRGAGGSNPYS